MIPEIGVHEQLKNEPLLENSTTQKQVVNISRARYKHLSEKNIFLTEQENTTMLGNVFEAMIAK